LKTTRYAISWLYGEFRIVRLQRGKIVERWSANQQVETVEDLSSALQEAAKHIDLSRGGDLAVVHEHDLHTHDFLQVPAMKKRDLEKFLARRVQQNKSFEEPAAWCYHEVVHTDGSEGVLLHQLPKSIVESTLAACIAPGLEPTRYVPLTEIVSAYMPTYKVPATDVFVIVALFNARIEIIVTFGTGEVAFVRELNYGHVQETVERLVTDINRTIRYAKQQLRTKIEEVWFLGTVLEDAHTTLESGVDSQLRFIPDESAGPYFWALQAAALSNKSLNANFISAPAQKSITSQRTRRAAVWVSILLMTISTGITAGIEWMVNDSQNEIGHLQVEIIDIEHKLAIVEETLELEKNLEKKLQVLTGTTSNLPTMFNQHLARMVPAGITLSTVKVVRQAGYWSVKLSGTAADGLEGAVQHLRAFEDALTAPPWSLQLEEDWRPTWFDQLQNGNLAIDGRIGFEFVGNIQ